MKNIERRIRLGRPAGGGSPMSLRRLEIQRQREERTRKLILEHAIARASVEGMDGLTIRRVAQDVGLSEDSVSLLFGGNEGLQMATLDAVVAVFVVGVVAPALGEPDPLIRLRKLCDRWFEYVDSVFPGGGFLPVADGECRARPARLRGRIRKHCEAWSHLIEQAITTAQARGAARADMDAAHVAFELLAFQAAAKTAALHGDEPSFARAQKCTRDRIDRLACV